MNRTSIVLLLMIAIPNMGIAQTPVLQETTVLGYSGFFITILAGVLLAIGFQFFLTALSIALGVSSIDNVKEKYVENKYSLDDRDDDDDKDSTISTGVMITSVFGLWNVITVSLSLFAATLLALNLNIAQSAIVNITLALSIWAAFYLLMFYLESKLASTMIGGLINTAISGLRMSTKAISTLFTPSPNTQVQNVVDNTITKIRKEFDSSFDLDAVDQTLNKYLAKFNKQLPDYDTLKKDLKGIMSEASSDGSPATWTAIQGVINKAIDEQEPNSKSNGQQKDRVQQLKNLKQELTATYQNADSKAEGLKKVTARLTPLEKKEIDQYWADIKGYLQTATPDGLNEKAISEELNKWINNPKQARVELKEKINQLDQDTVVEWLSTNTNLSQRQLNSYAEKVNQGIEQAKQQLGVGKYNQNGTPLAKQAESKVAQFINSTDVPELNYQVLKRDFTRAFNNPNESLSIIKRRLNTFDRDTLLSLVTNNSYVDRKDINQVVNSIENAQKEVSQQVSDMEAEARRRMVNLERKAVIQAEAARRTAVSAAWWLVLTILISGIASTVGGIITIG